MVSEQRPRLYEGVREEYSTLRQYLCKGSTGNRNVKKASMVQVERIQEKKVGGFFRGQIVNNNEFYSK